MASFKIVMEMAEGNIIHGLSQEIAAPPWRGFFEIFHADRKKIGLFTISSRYK